MKLLCANPKFNNNGHDQKSLLPMLSYASFTDQQSATAQIRDLVSYSSDDVFSWFVPNKRGDHDLKFGVNYVYTVLRYQEYVNQNGTFTFNHDLPFNAADPRTYPERFSIRVPGTTKYTITGQNIGMFAQDEWKAGDRLTLSFGTRYDLELVPTPNKDNPLFAGNPDSYPFDTNNVSPRLGFTYALDGQGRSALRGGMGLFFQQTVYGFFQPMFSDGRYAASYIVNFPTDNIDPGPRAGQFPTDPRLANGPIVDHPAIDALFPPAGTLQRNGGVVRFDSPDREVQYSRQYSLGYQTQFGSAFGLSLDFVRSESRNQLMLEDLNPARRATALATGVVTRTTPLVGAVGEFATRVDTIVNDGWINYNSVQVSAMKRHSQGYSVRLSYAFSRGRGNLPTGQADQINSQYLSDLRLDTEIGPTAVDRPHILSVTGAWDVPRTSGLKLSGVLQARSGLPFSLINTTFDADQNGLTTNQYLAAGGFSGTGVGAITVENQGGRNGARGPNYISGDVRGGYQFRLAGGRTLDAFVNVFNIGNRVNFANPASDQRLAGTFLKVTQIVGAMRTVNINVRLGF